MDVYELIDPPFSLQFRDMTRRQLREYAHWFHESTPARVAQLGRAVSATSGYELWQPDYSPASLVDLSTWFDCEVELRPRTDEELRSIRGAISIPIHVSEHELTDRTISLSMDIGMYFGQVVLRNVPGTEWTQRFTAKTSIDYGQPVIIGLGVVPLNPVQTMLSAAYGSAYDRGVNLKQMFDRCVSK